MLIWTGYGPNGTGVNTDAEFADALASNGMDNATVAILEMLYPNIPAAGIPSPANYSGPENFFGTQVRSIPNKCPILSPPPPLLPSP